MNDKRVRHEMLKLEIYGHLKPFLQMLLYRPGGALLSKNMLEKINLLNDFTTIGILPSLEKYESEKFLRGLFEIYYMKAYTEDGINRASRLFDLWRILCEVMPKINKAENIEAEDVKQAIKQVMDSVRGKGMFVSKEDITKLLQTNYCLAVQAMWAMLLGNDVLDFFFAEKEENAFTGEGCVMCNIDKNILKEDG